MPTVKVLRVVDWNRRFENNRTRELKRMDWVPMPNQHDGDGFSELLDHPNGVAHYGAWALLAQVASKCREIAVGCGGRGTLLRDCAEPHDAASLARITKGDQKVFEEAIPRLLKIRWLEYLELEVPDNKTLTSIPQLGATLIPQDDAEECLRARAGVQFHSVPSCSEGGNAKGGESIPPTPASGAPLNVAQGVNQAQGTPEPGAPPPLNVAQSTPERGAGVIYNRQENRHSEPSLNHKERVRVGENMKVLKEALCGLFKRNPTDPWGNDEEHYLYDVAKRQNCTSEVLEIQEFFKKGSFRNQKVRTLLADWTGALDTARNYDENNKRNTPKGFDRNAGTLNEGKSYRYSKEYREKQASIRAAQQVSDADAGASKNL